MTQHRLDAAPQTVHWGYFDAQLAPRLTIASGESVTISTVSGPPEVMPDAGFTIPDALPAIHAAMTPRLPGHICTGPVAVEGLRAGQVLEVRIDAIDLHYDWGYNTIGPLKGALPDDFTENRLMHIPLDRERMTGRLPWGLDLPLAPFFGVMAVAPPPAWGALSTLPPRRNGGNLDNKELVAGTTLYLPCFVDGGNFSVGDGHGAQGDGEVCVTAIETALQGRFRLTVRRDLDVTYPEAETPTHLITMGMHPDLDTCVEMALRRMITVVSQRSGISREQAYMLCSLAADLRITQTVNREKGVHMMISKALL